MHVSGCQNAPSVTILDRIPHIESHSVFSWDHRQSQVWELYFLGISLKRTEVGQRILRGTVHGVSKSQTRWVTEQTHMDRQKQDNGRWEDYMYMTDLKSSISSLPSFWPVLTHLLGCKQICQHLSFHRRPSARSQMWAASAFLQSCSWVPWWPAFWVVKPATGSRVSPSSPLLYRLERKEVSAWKEWEEGCGGCCQPSLDFSSEVSNWTPETLLHSQKVSLCVCF